MHTNPSNTINNEILLHLNMVIALFFRRKSLRWVILSSTATRSESVTQSSRDDKKNSFFFSL